MTEITGFGLGLRPDHYDDLRAQPHAVDWLEALTENYLVAGGKPLANLFALRSDLPVSMHGVSLNIAGHDALDWDYLRQVRELASKLEPWLISDHLCFTRHAGVSLHDLLPIAFNADSLTHVAARVAAVQDYLGRPLTIENVSSYTTWKSSDRQEWEFLVELVERTGCRLLLDVNNVYVSARNHGFAAADFIQAIPASAVQQIHLAGHTDHGDHVVDTHDAPIRSEVFGLYRLAIRCWGAKPTCIERDANIPPLADLLAELDAVRAESAAALIARAQAA